MRKCSTDNLRFLAMKCLAVICVLVSLLSCGPVASADQPSSTKDHEWWNSHLPDALKLYQWFHQHPEVSLEEEKTAAKLAEQWRRAGLSVTTNVGGHGIVGILKNGDGRTVMLRTDLDALPVLERTSLPYSSKSNGVMHACGHDIHMTNISMVAQYLADHPSLWTGTLMLVGQPAEERGLGAKRMIRDGLFTRFPRPDYALAIHVAGELPTGTIKMAAGYVGASSDSVDITVKGRGGHGSAPHTTIDPIVQAADLIMSLQTIVSREVKPVEAAVVTVGAINGGTKHNIIADECRLQLTVRSHSDEVREQLIKLIRAKGIADAYGAPAPIISVSEGVPALRNDPKLAERLQSLFVDLLGVEKIYAYERSMGFEDFSRYGEAGVSILMYGVGSVSQERLDAYKKQGVIPSLHSREYFPDAEKTLETAFVTMSAAAIELFGHHK